MNKGNYLLPEEIECPYCKVDLEIEETERLKGNFICPGCNKEVTKKYLLTLHSKKEIKKRDTEQFILQSNWENRTSKFSEHNKLTIIVAITLIVTSGIGIISVIYLAVKFASLMGIAIMGIGFSAIGSICGICLWKRFKWSLTGSLIYFVLQVMAIQTPNFNFFLRFGVYFHVQITLGSNLFSLNLFALLMIILTIWAKYKLHEYSPNKTLHMNAKNISCEH